AGEGGVEAEGEVWFAAAHALDGAGDDADVEEGDDEIVGEVVEEEGAVVDDLLGGGGVARRRAPGVGEEDGDGEGGEDEDAADRGHQGEDEEGFVFFQNVPGRSHQIPGV